MSKTTLRKMLSEFNLELLHANADLLPQQTRAYYTPQQKGMLARTLKRGRALRQLISKVNTINNSPANVQPPKNAQARHD